MKQEYYQERGAVMKRLLPLCLAIMLAACDQAPPAAPDATPQVKATPVLNAPKTLPMPIQPLSSAPAMPVTQPLPLIKAPAETGTAHAKPTVSSTAALSATASATVTPAAAAPSPSVSGS